MNAKLSAWLKKDIRVLPPRKKVPPPLWLQRTYKILKRLVLLLFAGLVIWRIVLGVGIHHRFAALRAAGLPTNGEELNHWRPPVPDAENGALTLARAFASMRTFPDSRSNLLASPELLDRTNHWSLEMRQMVAEYVATNAPAIEAAKAAATFHRFRFPVDFSYGPDTQFPHLSQLKSLTRILALKATLSMDRPDGSEWPDDVILQLQLAATLNDEPDIISHLVRNSIVRSAATIAELGFSRTNPGDDPCRRLQIAFADTGATNLLPNALIGERAIMIPVFRMSWSEIQNAGRNEDTNGHARKPQRYSGNPQFIIWLSGMMERDLNFFLQATAQGITTASLPPPNNLALTNKLEAQLHVAQKRGYFFSAMYLPALSSVIRREATVKAYVELAQVAAAAARYHSAHGTWPADLQKLQPQFLQAIPNDPIDGNPLRYRLTTNGYVVYSIGLDGHDDGGREKPGRTKSDVTNSYDFTFTVEH